jgi:hypothetical protein
MTRMSYPSTSVVQKQQLLINGTTMYAFAKEVEMVGSADSSSIAMLL